jgi:FKBP-type peptidyl-prolyl cis-trans isomerase
MIWRNLLVALLLGESSGADVPPTPGQNLPSDAPLNIEVLSKPDVCDKKARKNDLVSVHYTGWSLSNGKKFDSSRDRGSPFQFTLGVGQVIKGWDQGVSGACIGESRRLTIPSGMAYGPRGIPGVIGEDATLVFNVELLGIGDDDEL